jgi:hypothetical protein
MAGKCSSVTGFRRMGIVLSEPSTISAIRNRTVVIHLLWWSHASERRGWTGRMQLAAVECDEQEAPLRGLDKNATPSIV